MKGGQKPVLRQKWYPTDYHQDEHVRLLYVRRDWRTLTFYRTFIDQSFTNGGDLPADPEALAASVFMPVEDVRAALGFCLERLIWQEGDRLFQTRTRREVRKEHGFRESQAVLGRLGGETAGRGRPKESDDRATPISADRATPLDSIGPPLPLPLPKPSNGTPPNPLALRGGSDHEPAASPPDGHPDDQPDHSRKGIERRLEWARRFWISLGGHPTRQDLKLIRARLKAGDGDGEIGNAINAAHKARAAPQAAHAAAEVAWDWIQERGGQQAVVELVRAEARAEDGLEVWRLALKRLGAPTGVLGHVGPALGEPPRAPPTCAPGEL